MADTSSVLSQTAVALRLIECGVLFLAVPLLLTLLRGTIPPIPVLIGVTLLLGSWLFLDKSFDRAVVLNTHEMGRHLFSVLALWAVCAVVLLVVLYWYEPSALFRFPRERPGIWLIVMCLYPIASVIPQTIIYRAFFFHRYEPVFQQLKWPAWAFVVLAGIAFCLGHVIFKNWVAIALTLAGGLIFAFRYDVTRSLPLSAIEHAIYGQLIFTLGYGLFLYHGSVRMVQGTSGGSGE